MENYVFPERLGGCVRPVLLKGDDRDIGRIVAFHASDRNGKAGQSADRSVRARHQDFCVSDPQLRLNILYLTSGANHK